ncbi:MAG TPA: energy transducer TonB [Sphingomicrobium sp.]|nr:energy transducer TonB [Sphingomicrobium sp.]
MIARAFGVAVVLVGVVGQSAAAAAVDPIGDWKIESSEARCVAVRKYGDVADPITLALKAPPYKSDVLQLAIIRSGYRKSAEQSGAKIVIDSQEYDTYALGYPLASHKQTATLFTLSPTISAALRKASSFSFSLKGGARENFAFGPSESMWTDLAACVERLSRTWNMEGVEASFAQRVSGSLRGIFTSADYPREAVLAQFAGSSRVLLLIDEAGNVKDCTVLETSGMAVLDSRTCGVITQRAKFTPAVGADGKPMKDSYVQRIDWTVRK